MEVELIARENIEEGDVVVKLWFNYCRRAKAVDVKIVGIAQHDVCRGQKLKLKL